MSEPAVITSAQAPDVDDVRSWIEKMIKAARFIDLVVAVISLITRMRDFNTELSRRIAGLQKKRPRSERLSCVRQYAFSFATVMADKNASNSGEASPEGAAASTANDSPVPGPPPKPKRPRKGRHPGRKELPAHLDRVPETNRVPLDQRVCPLCGLQMKTVGHSICEILDIRPAELYVRQRLDERVSCPVDHSIVSAPTPPELVERGKLGTTLIVEALADKYLEHQPIERQCLRWERTGVEIAPQTLGRSVAVAIDTLRPLAAAIETRTREPGLLATDATGLPVLDRDAPDGVRNGTMWCWANARWVSFVYSPKGDSASVRRFLGDRVDRVVQCDGTSITTFIEREGGHRPGCWSHARRGLVDAVAQGDRVALSGLEIIAKLFAVERQSARAGETAVARLERRRNESQPVIAELRRWLDEKRATAPPRTVFGKALGYLERQWKRLVLFLEDGNIELTNNRIERELRKLVLGRRNWLFAWGDLGGERTATILTIIGTCIAHGVNPRAYLHLVTNLIVAGWPKSQLRELLPDRVLVSHPELGVLEEKEPAATTPAATTPTTPAG